MAFSQIQGKMQIMRILIANDDGIYAAGIKAIAAEFSKKHQVMVVAPDHERSGASHSINLTSPLRIHKTELSGFDNIEAYRVNGTPVDCVIVGCNALNFKPDAIITGVNHGYNLGMDIHYSGTVSAAKEGALMGIPSMAVSMCNLTSKDFSVPASKQEVQALCLRYGNGQRADSVSCALFLFAFVCRLCFSVFSIFRHPDCPGFSHLQTDQDGRYQALPLYRL